MTDPVNPSPELPIRDANMAHSSQSPQEQTLNSLPGEMPPQSEAAALKPDPLQALRFPSYRLFVAGRVFSILAWQMQAAAISWELYNRTGSAYQLGLVGLMQFLPVLVFTLPSGELADRVKRKSILLTGQVLLIGITVGLFLWSAGRGPVFWVYVILFGIGTVRTFNNTASASLSPQIVSREAFPNATVWNGATFQTAAVCGPALGGWLLAAFSGATTVYAITGGMLLVSLSCYAGIRVLADRVEKSTAVAQSPLRSMAEGSRFVYRTKIILAAITLDMFAVLFGGVTQLLPVFAKDILHVGALGYGWLRAAPAVGAVVMTIVLAFSPPMKQAGKVLLVVVIGFGLATIGFGLSKVFWFSMLMLFLTGLLDSVSMVIRGTLVQMRTPDWLRGRVSAVNNIFISSSNELGGYESGLIAAWFGPVVSAVSGGMGTIVTVLVIAMIWPQIRRFDSLTDTE